MGTITTMQSAAASKPQPAPPSRPHRAPMAMTVAELEAAIAALPGKRDALREPFDRLAACSLAPLRFAWEDLDGHISSLQSSIALRFRQLRGLEAAGAVPAAAALGGTRGDDGKGENQEGEEEEEVVEVEVEEENADEEADRDKICNDEKDGKEAREVEVEKVTCGQLKDLIQPSSMLEAQKASTGAAGSNTTGQPEGGPDYRTVFVSNVHFGASKDALSRHFNKLGAILKTHIVTDGVTGQATGSAYIEFLNKNQQSRR